MREGIYNSAPGVLVLQVGDRLPVTANPHQDDPAFGMLDRARDLIDALNALGRWPYSKGDASGELTDELRRVLLEAAAATSNSPFAEHLELREEALASNDFEAAIQFGASHRTSFELLLGPSPTYILPARDRGLSAVLAAAVAEPLQEALPEFDGEIVALASRCIDESRASISGPTFEPPLYSICDLLWAAGGAAVPPFHFSHFLPEDEGLKGATTKTVVYRNLFTLRFRRISLPLLERRMPGLDADAIAAAAPPILLRWLRAHDVAHSYFDQVCFAAGPTAPILHGTREILADSLADALLLGDREPGAALTVILGEMERLARRDPTLFADAWAARVELAWLAKQVGEPWEASSAALSGAFLELIAETLDRLAGPSPIAFEDWVERLAAEYGDTAPPPLADDVVPVFGASGATRGVRPPKSRCSHS